VPRFSGGVSLEVDGLLETMEAIKRLQPELRNSTNGAIRDAGMECAGKLAVDLRAAAVSSGVPVAPRVARSIKVKRDRLPVVTIGGSRKVGARGAPAGALVWGSEQGPKGETNHFGVPPSSGYWIAPTVERFATSTALSTYKRAVADALRKVGLA